MPRHPLKSSKRRRPAGTGSRAWISGGLLVLLLGGLGWYFWHRSSEVSGPSEPARERVAPVQEAPPPVPPPTPVPVPEPVRTNEVVTTPGPSVEPVPPPPAETNAPPEPAEKPKPVVTPPPVRLEADVERIPDRPPTNILEAQIALTAYGIGSGSIDGIGGAQTAWALRAFQFQRGLEETGRLDPATQKELKFTRPLYRQQILVVEDLERLAPVPAGWLEKAAMNQLGHETLLERVAEQNHAHPQLIRRLNPSVNWDTARAGTVLIVPNAAYPPARKAALVRISLANRYLRAFDGRGNLLAHFPCSIGRIAEKRPVGELQAAVVVKDPNYTFNPEVFPESAEARRIGRKLMIPPGPNNPVGVAWIGLSRPGYGIHGTPIPEQVGRTESHGCFRLANWNADYLRRMMSVGTPVWVEL